MFLFKLGLPFLGTATLGAVGIGIYYWIKKSEDDSNKKLKEPLHESNSSNSEREFEEDPVTKETTQETDPEVVLEEEPLEV